MRRDVNGSETIRRLCVLVIDTNISTKQEGRMYGKEEEEESGLRRVRL